MTKKNEEILDEEGATRPNDKSDGDKNPESLESTSEQKSNASAAKKRPADKNTPEQDEHDPSGLDDQGNKQQKDKDGEEYNTLQPEKSAATVKEEFENNTPSFSLDEELGSLLESEELSEDFRKKAGVVFESAINTILEAEHAKMVERFGETLEEALELQEAEIENKVSKYVDYVAEEWMEENKLAVETGVRNEINESIVSDIVDILEKHNINISDDQIDVVEEERSARERAEKTLDEQVEKTLSVREQLDEAKKLLALSHFSRENSLTMLEEEKLVEMTRKTDFEDFETFTESLQTLKENYFGGSSKNDADTLTEDVEGEVLDEEKNEKKSDPVMKMYNETFNRAFGKK